VSHVQIELVTPRHEPNYEMRTLRIPSLHTVSTVAGHLRRQDGNLTTACVNNCYSNCHGHVTHNYEYASFGAFHSVQLIQQSTTDVCVHLSVMSLLGVDCNCWGQTKVSGNRCHPAVDRGLYMWNVVDGTKPKRSKQNLPQYHFVHHKYHLDCPGTEPEPLQRLAT